MKWEKAIPYFGFKVRSTYQILKKEINGLFQNLSIQGYWQTFPTPPFGNFKDLKILVYLLENDGKPFGNCYISCIDFYKYLAGKRPCSKPTPGNLLHIPWKFLDRSIYRKIGTQTPLGKFVNIPVWIKNGIAQCHTEAASQTFHTL